MIEGLKPYAEYKESGHRWLGKLPDHWAVLPLCRVATPKSECGRPELELLSVYLHRGVIRYSESGGQVHKPSIDLSKYQVVEPGDLVLNNQQAWRGSIGVSKHKGIISPAYVIMKLRPTLSPGYANYLFRSPSMVAQYVVASRGVGDIQRNLYYPDLRGSTVVVPPPDEQAAIVRFLDHANRKIDGFIRAKRKLIGLLNEQKQAIIHRAVTGKDEVRMMKDENGNSSFILQPSTLPKKPSGIPWLGDIPAHWEVLRLGRVIKLITGFPFKSDGFTQKESAMRLLRGINVTPNGLRWDSNVRWERTQSDGLDDFLLQVGDIVLGMDRPIIAAGVRAAAIAPQDVPSLLLQRVARLRPKERITEPFLLLLLQGRLFAEYIAPIFTGISVPHLSPEQIKGFKVMLPPVGEQEDIVGYIAKETAVLNTAIARTEREIVLMQEYRTRLTADLVTGKLDVREAAAKLPDLPTDTSAAPDEPLEEIETEEVEA